MTEPAHVKRPVPHADTARRKSSALAQGETWTYQVIPHAHMPLSVLCDVDRRVIAIDFAGDAERLKRMAEDYGARLVAASTLSSNEAPSTALAVRELEAYLAGRLQVFTTPLRLIGSPFQVRVWHALIAVPFGDMRTYGELAAELGGASAARAVGTAAGRNPVPVVVPCHRLVAAGGALGGFSGGLDNKRWLLDHEARHAPAGRKGPAVQLEF